MPERRARLRFAALAGSCLFVRLLKCELESKPSERVLMVTEHCGDRSAFGVANEALLAR